jgi:hypothetical protein
MIHFGFFSYLIRRERASRKPSGVWGQWTRPQSDEIEGGQTKDYKRNVRIPAKNNSEFEVKSGWGAESEQPPVR